MIKISVIGHFAYGKSLLNGQTIKTRIVSETLENEYGSENVKGVDTHGGLRFLLKMPFILWNLLRTSDNVVVMPAQNGVRTILPIICLYNLFFHRNILYVVIGGWLAGMLEGNRILRTVLKRINGVFVETKSMKHKVENLGLSNVHVMPNCKKLEIVKDDKDWSQTDLLPLCTFSRVMQEKGIAEAIDAVIKANEVIGKKRFSLDIYGQVEKGQEEWFSTLMSGQPEYIRYRGCVSFDKSAEVLCNYYALLFPTYYKGEGFAGTVIDAFAAGLPVLATDWHDNADIVKHGETGYIYSVKDPGAITSILLNIHGNLRDICKMRLSCREEAKKFQPQVVIKTLIQNIR